MGIYDRDYMKRPEGRGSSGPSSPGDRMEQFAQGFLGRKRLLKVIGFILLGLILAGLILTVL